MSMLASLERDATCALWQVGAAGADAAGAGMLASRNQQTAFFLGEPIKVAGRIW